MSHKNTQSKIFHLNKELYSTRSSANVLDFEPILHTISQLEQFLIEDHRQYYKLRMALDKQNEKVLDLKACLRNEKQRNKRLLDLILSIDSESPEVEMEEEVYKVTNRHLKEPFEFISPLLMQQRYEDLSCSYNICRKQLLKRDQELKIIRCEKELLESKFDNLLDEFKQNQKRLERACEKGLCLKQVKNFKIHYLKDALNYATNCLLTAQYIIDTLALENKKLYPFKHEFQQNLQLFLNKLLLNEGKYCSCYKITNIK